MDACRRIVAVLIVSLWAIGAMPARGGADHDDRASRRDGVGVLAYRRHEWASGVSGADEDPRDDVAVSGESPRVVSRASVVRTAADHAEGGATHLSPRHSGSPRGPPIA